MDVREARLRAAAMLAAIRNEGPLPTKPEETLFEAVAEAVFRRHERIWKPRTLAVNCGYLRKQILPRFAGRQVAEITRQDVVHWFAALGATPVAADRSMPVLSVIMREAERMGFRKKASNPCRGIRRYRDRAGSGSSPTRRSGPSRAASTPERPTGRSPAQRFGCSCLPAAANRKS